MSLTCGVGHRQGDHAFANLGVDDAVAAIKRVLVRDLRRRHCAPTSAHRRAVAEVERPLVMSPSGSMLPVPRNLIVKSHCDRGVKNPQPQWKKPDSVPPSSGTWLALVQTVRGLDCSHCSPPEKKGPQSSGVLISSTAVGARLLGTQPNSSIVVPDLTIANSISSPAAPSIA